MARCTSTLLTAALACALLLAAVQPAHGQGRVTLRRPVLVTLIPPGVITADGSPQTLLFMVTDETGGLAMEANWRGSRADVGTLGNWTQLGPGVFTATYTMPPVSEPVTATLELKVKVGSYKAEKAYALTVEPAAGARFSMTATPEQLTLGQDEMVVLTFTAVGPAGSPLEGLDLQVGSSLGAVSEVQPLGGGTYRAEYRPPDDQKAPALVILSLVDKAEPELSTMFMPLALVGATEWKIEAGVPFAPVGMMIGDMPYGPAIADENGVAMVPIVVPPGIREGAAFQFDAEGQPGPRVGVDLRLPDFKCVEVAPMASYVPGNGAAGYPVYIFVVGQDARPLNDAPLQLEVSHGDFVALDVIGPGTFRAMYVPPAVAAPTEVTISAVVLGAEQNFGDRITVEVVPGPPAGFWFSTNPTAVNGGTQTIALSGEVMNPAGPLTPGTGVSFAGLDGVIPMEIAPGDNIFQASFTGSFDQPVPMSAEVTIPAAARPAKALVAWPVMDQVGVNGTMPVVAMALDRYGMPVSGVELSATTLNNVGTVTGGGPTDAFGRTVFTFQATPLSGATAVLVTDGERGIAVPLWQADSLMLGFGFPLQGGRLQTGMMQMWGALRGRLLVGAGAPPPPPRPQQAQAATGPTPGAPAQPVEPEEPAPIPTVWGDQPSASSGGTADPSAVWTGEVEAALTTSDPERRALRDVNVVATDDGKYDIAVRYSHAATVVTVAGNKVQLSQEEWFAGWAALVGTYTRSSDFRSRDFRLTNLDTGRTLVLSTSDCRTLVNQSTERRVETVQAKARTE